MDNLEKETTLPHFMFVLQNMNCIILLFNNKIIVKFYLDLHYQLGKIAARQIHNFMKTTTEEEIIFYQESYRLFSKCFCFSLKKMLGKSRGGQNLPYQFWNFFQIKFVLKKAANCRCTCFNGKCCKFYTKNLIQGHKKSLYDCFYKVLKRFGLLFIHNVNGLLFLITCFIKT